MTKYLIYREQKFMGEIISIPLKKVDSEIEAATIVNSLRNKFQNQMYHYESYED